MQTDESRLLAGRYRLGELQEQRGEVEQYDALDSLLDRPVRVEMLTEVGASGTDYARAFLRHQQIAASLTQCSVIEVYDAGTWNGRPFSVTESTRGRPPSSLFRPGYPPDVQGVLRAARQTAEALACCREAGLSDWSFGPEAVRIDAEGNAYLAIVEGLTGPYTSASPSTDSRALAALMKIMLTGKPDAGEHALRAALVPAWLLPILERLDPMLGGSMRTAAQFARELEAAEESSAAPTQAYIPAPQVEAAPDPYRTLSVASPAALADAPTLPAKVPVPKVAAQTAALSQGDLDKGAYTPPSVVARAGHDRGPLALAGGGALLLVLLAWLFVPLMATSQKPSTGSKAPVTLPPPSVTPAPAIATVPDLRGKNLDGARTVLHDSGLNLSTGPNVYDESIGKDLISAQEPAPGTALSAGQSVTVTVSLGPQPQAAPAQSKPPTQAAPPAPAAQPAHEPPGKQKGAQDHGKGKKDK